MRKQSNEIQDETQDGEGSELPASYAKQNRKEPKYLDSSGMCRTPLSVQSGKV